jgi:predicted class III extradiol MEMO1 family dioxygenase
MPYRELGTVASTGCSKPTLEEVIDECLYILESVSDLNHFETVSANFELKGNEKKTSIEFNEISLIIKDYLICACKSVFIDENNINDVQKTRLNTIYNKIKRFTVEKRVEKDIEIGMAALSKLKEMRR